MARHGAFQGTWQQESSGAAGPMLVLGGVALLIVGWLSTEWQKAQAVRAEAEAREAEALARMPAVETGGSVGLVVLGVVVVLVVAVAVGFAVAAWVKLRQMQDRTVVHRPVGRPSVEGKVIELSPARPVGELEAMARHPAGKRVGPTPMQQARIRREARR